MGRHRGQRRCRVRRLAGSRPGRSSVGPHTRDRLRLGPRRGGLDRGCDRPQPGRASPCRIRSCARRRPGCDFTCLARPRPGRWGAGAGGHRRGPQCVFLHLQSPLPGVGRRTLCRRHDQPRFLRHLSERHRRPTGICGRTLPLRRHPPVVHPAAGRQAGLERSRASGLQHPAAGQGDRSAGGQSQGRPADPRLPRLTALSAGHRGQGIAP